MKRPMKENMYDPKERCEIYCFTPQLSDRIEEANKSHSMLYVPFIEVTLGENFMPLDLIGTDQDKRRSAVKAVVAIWKLMCLENKKGILQNLDHVIKKLEDGNDGEFHFCGEKYNDFGNSRFILN